MMRQAASTAGRTSLPRTRGITTTATTASAPSTRNGRAPCVRARASSFVDRPGGGAGTRQAPTPAPSSPLLSAIDPALSLSRPSGGSRDPFSGERSASFATPVAASSSSRPGGRTSRSAAFDAPTGAGGGGNSGRGSDSDGSDPALISRPGGRASRSADFGDASPTSSVDPADVARPGGRAGRGGDVLAAAGGGGGDSGVPPSGGGGGSGGSGGGSEGSSGGSDGEWSKSSLTKGGVAYLGVCVGALALNDAAAGNRKKTATKGATGKACCRK